jgi:hypothetical protein
MDRRTLLAGATAAVPVAVAEEPRPARAVADVAEALRGLHRLWDVGNMHEDDAARVALESAIADLERLSGEAGHV